MDLKKRKNEHPNQMPPLKAESDRGIQLLLLLLLLNVDLTRKWM